MEGVRADSTFRNSVWAGEAGDRVCAQGGGGQGRFLVADRQADRQRCACVRAQGWSLQRGGGGDWACEGKGRPVDGGGGRAGTGRTGVRALPWDKQKGGQMLLVGGTPPGRRVWKCNGLPGALGEELSGFVSLSSFHCQGLRTMMNHDEP